MKTLTHNKTLIAILGALILTVFVGIAVQYKMAVAGYIQADAGSPTARYVKYDFFASSTPNSTPTTFATTTSATSTLIASWTDGNGRIDTGKAIVAGAKQVTFYFGRGGATSPNTGSSVFNVEVSYDGTTWVRYNKLISNVSNTNAQTLTRAEQFTISAATSTVIASMSPEDSVYAVRCIVVEVTDGEHTCKAMATY